MRGDQKIRELIGRKTKVFGQGQIIIEAEQPHDFVYRLKSGWATRVRTLEDGRTQYILIFLPGDLFAVKSMYIPKHPDAVQALSDCVVELIDQSILRDACGNDIDIAMRCTWQVVEEERRLHTWVVGLGQSSAEERLALLLLEFRGRLISSGHIDEEATTFEMPMTQVQLADHLGISAVHTNRVLTNFRKSGIVILRDRTAIIVNFGRLLDAGHALLDVYERNSPIFAQPRRSVAVI